MSSLGPEVKVARRAVLLGTAHIAFSTLTFKNRQDSISDVKTLDKIMPVQRQQGAEYPLSDSTIGLANGSTLRILGADHKFGSGTKWAKFFSQAVRDSDIIMQEPFVAENFTQDLSRMLGKPFFNLEREETRKTAKQVQVLSTRVHTTSAIATLLTGIYRLCNGVGSKRSLIWDGIILIAGGISGCMHFPSLSASLSKMFGAKQPLQHDTSYLGNVRSKEMVSRIMLCSLQNPGKKLLVVMGEGHITQVLPELKKGVAR